MALVLYECSPTRSLRDRWVLQELDVPFTSVEVDLAAGGHRSPEFLKINPAGKLPALVDDGAIVTESAAIALHLADKFPEKRLMPLDIASRAQVLRWIFFAVTELEQPLWRRTKHRRIYPGPLRLAADVDLAGRDFAEMAGVLERHMEQREFVAVDQVTVADFIVAYTLDWASASKLLESFPVLTRYMERMYERPRAPGRIQSFR